jgi:AcrR family transcriptional regulator
VDRHDTERVLGMLQAACRVIGREGAHGLRMDAVAREAGVSKALVHYYFATRRDLLRAAFLYSEDRANARAEAELALLETGAERLERLLVLDLDEEPVFTENRALWSEAWSLMRLDKELRPVVERQYRAWNDRLLELVEEGRSDGSIPRDIDSERMVRRLAAVVDGLESQLLLGLVKPAQAAETAQETVDRELDRPGSTLRGKPASPPGRPRRGTRR